MMQLNEFTARLVRSGTAWDEARQQDKNALVTVGEMVVIAPLTLAGVSQVERFSATYLVSNKLVTIH